VIKNRVLEIETQANYLNNLLLHIGNPVASAVKRLLEQKPRYEQRLTTLRQRAVTERQVWQDFQREVLEESIRNAFGEGDIAGVAKVKTLVEDLKWQIRTKELILKNRRFKKGERVYAKIRIEFEEISTDLGKVSERTYQIEGFLKPVIQGEQDD